MEYVILLIIGAAAGILTAEVTVPRWKPIPAIADIVLTIALVIAGLQLIDDSSLPLALWLAVVANAVSMTLYTPVVWSRAAMPVAGSYWWWLRMTFFHNGTLSRLHKEHIRALREHTPSPVASDP